jgi:hypothetical protein
MMSTERTLSSTSISAGAVDPPSVAILQDAGLPKPSGGPLADIAAVPAIHNDASAGKAMRPDRNGLGFHLPRCRQRVTA